jgi:hypothetical protein
VNWCLGLRTSNGAVDADKTTLFRVSISWWLIWIPGELRHCLFKMNKKFFKIVNMQLNIHTHMTTYYCKQCNTVI